MKHVLLVSHEMSVSGAPNSLLRQAMYFRDAGCQVDVWTPKLGALVPRYEEAGFHPELVPDDRRAIEARYLRDRIPYDLIICNTLVTWKFVDVLQRYRLCVVWFIRETLVLDFYMWHRSDFAALLRRFYNLYTVSDYNAAALRRYNPHVTVIRNSIIDNFKAFSQPAAKLRIGYIGTFVRMKGLDLLVDAFRRLHADHPEVELRIAGNPAIDIGPGLVKATAGDTSIIWLGEVQGPAKEAFFDNIDVLCVPSLDEPCGLTLIEGAMKGKILITTDHTGANYLVDEKCGFIVPSLSSEALEDAMRRILAMTPETRASFGHHARERYLALGTPEQERQAVLRLLEEAPRHRAPRVFSRLYYDGEEPFFHVHCNPDGRRFFYCGPLRVFATKTKDVGTWNKPGMM